ncbi:MAG: pyridoxine 5'-phosphate synthase, partial [Candidatus Omnitrophica bacterium]|nr:pyridoxine 5'-phosphate synthase [Candidatus Omnitrophota bacterium]
MKLGVNVDHIATLRQVRGTLYPVPSAAAAICQNYGADSIVMHLREDRRHINDNDVLTLKNNITVPFNMEMSVNKEIVAIALKIKPYSVTLVPEKRKELTT